MMQSSGEPLSTRKMVIMIAVVCIVGFLIVDRPGHGKRSVDVRSFIGQKNDAHATGTDKVSTDVLNGIPVNAGDFSAVVGITGTIITAPHLERKCTGVLLSKEDVLTAGHCCHGARSFRVHTGRRFFQDTPITVRTVALMAGYRYDRTKDANGQTIETPEKDLCMLTLATQVSFTPEKIYISTSKPRVGTLVDIVGYGMIGSNTLSGDRLHYAQTVVTACTNALTWANNKANVVNDIVCAGHAATTRTDAHNACSGDSGGPLLSRMLTKSNARILYGILSDGDKPCRIGKNSYTDVAKRDFKNFIARHNIDATWLPFCRS